MKDVELKMLERAKALLASGEVARVIGWKKGEFFYDPTPATFETVEELKDFADISVENIRTVTEGNVSFKLLTLQQYFQVVSCKLFLLHLHQMPDTADEHSLPESIL